MTFIAIFRLGKVQPSYPAFFQDVDVGHQQLALRGDPHPKQRWLWV